MIKDFKISPLILLILISCGKQLRTEEKVIHESHYGTPLIYEFGNKDCNQLIQSNTPPEIVLYGGESFDKHTLNKIMNKDLVNNIHVGGKYSSTNMSFKLETISAAIEFEECMVLPRNETQTFEDATISILAPLNNYEDQFREIHAKYKIPKVNITVLPQIDFEEYVTYKSHKELRTSTFTNNAMYIAAQKILFFYLREKSLDLIFLFLEFLYGSHL